jgi:hypothetical protein
MDAKGLAAMTCSQWWTCSQWSNFQRLTGPVATIIAAFAAVSVTWYPARHQKRIAEEQAHIAREKLRHDLYDRRFEIFSSIFDFHTAVILWEGSPEQQKARQRFFRAYQASGFLFKKESGIEDLLKKVQENGVEIIGSKNNDPDGFLLTPQHRSIFEESLRELKAAMHQYLDFSKL